MNINGVITISGKNISADRIEAVINSLPHRNQWKVSIEGDKIVISCDCTVLN